MENMFYNCSSLISLDLSKFIKQNLTVIDRIFYNCHSLLSLYLSNSNNKTINNMYNNIRYFLYNYHKIQ